MEAEQAATKGERLKTARELFQDRSVRWQLITNIMLTVAMQLCGINAVSGEASYQPACASFNAGVEEPG